MKVNGRSFISRNQVAGTRAVHLGTPGKMQDTPQVRQDGPTGSQERRPDPARPSGLNARSHHQLIGDACGTETVELRRHRFDEPLYEETRKRSAATVLPGGDPSSRRD